VARIRLSRDELYSTAESMIRRARGMTKLLMKNGCIKPMPD
jgi:hypothetical protein